MSDLSFVEIRRNPAFEKRADSCNLFFTAWGAPFLPAEATVELNACVCSVLQNHFGILTEQNAFFSGETYLDWARAEMGPFSKGSKTPTWEVGFPALGKPAHFRLPVFRGRRPRVGGRKNALAIGALRLRVTVF